tara:strand:- start:11909 stop:12157 length:249 start_codon:yes stop_codon:yes gene_type:complete
MENQIKKNSDMVNYPPHYRSHPSGVEVIEITEHLNFCLGNAVKYILRSDYKDSKLQDLKKAQWYVSREIRRLQDKPIDKTEF